MLSKKNVLLEFSIMEHCLAKKEGVKYGALLAKKELNNSTFFLKSVTYLPWLKSGGIQDFLIV